MTLQPTHFEGLSTVQSLFDPELPSTGKMFEPQSTDLYWDEQNPAIYAVYKKLVQQFWHASEVSLRPDIPQFSDSSKVSPLQRNLFLRAISQLIILDTVAAKVMSKLSDIIQNPAVVALFDYQSSQETIHNEAYTYIASSFVSKEEFQRVKENTKRDPLVLAATIPIIRVFNEFLSKEKPTPMDIVKVLVGMLALEGIRFTNGFVPFYQFNREDLLQAVGTIIQFINRDETQHSFGIAIVINMIIDEYELDQEEAEAFAHGLFKEVVAAEKELSKSFFDDYTKISTVQTQSYIEFRANSLLGNVGFEQIFETTRNPMRWITAFDSNKMGNQRADFFERRVNQYEKVTVESNGFDEL